MHWTDKETTTADLLIEELHQTGEISMQVGERTLTKKEMVSELEKRTDTAKSIVHEYINGSNIFLNHG